MTSFTHPSFDQGIRFWSGVKVRNMKGCNLQVVGDGYWKEERRGYFTCIPCYMWIYRFKKLILCYVSFLNCLKCSFFSVISMLIRLTISVISLGVFCVHCGVTQVNQQSNVKVLYHMCREVVLRLYLTIKFLHK